METALDSSLCAVITDSKLRWPHYGEMYSRGVAMHSIWSRPQRQPWMSRSIALRFQSQEEIVDLLHAAPFQGIIPRPYLKGIYLGFRPASLCVSVDHSQLSLDISLNITLEFCGVRLTEIGSCRFLVEGEKLESKMQKLESQYNSLQVLSVINKLGTKEVCPGSFPFIHPSILRSVRCLFARLFVRSYVRLYVLSFVQVPSDPESPILNLWTPPFPVPRKLTSVDLPNHRRSPTPKRETCWPRNVCAAGCPSLRWCSKEPKTRSLTTSGRRPCRPTESWASTSARSFTASGVRSSSTTASHSGRTSWRSSKHDWLAFLCFLCLTE